jgi:hypothetical protein
MWLLRIVSRDLERLCEISGTSVTFLTRVGYKSFNRLGRHRLRTAFETGTDRDIAPDTLRLGFDGLKDPYTLLGRRLADSPHIELMRTLEDGGDPRCTEYAERLTGGTLSQGLPVRFDEAYVRERFRARDAEIAGGTAQTVKTITIDGARYILDGAPRRELAAARRARALRGRDPHHLRRRLPVLPLCATERPASAVPSASRSSRPGLHGAGRREGLTAPASRPRLTMPAGRARPLEHELLGAPSRRWNGCVFRSRLPAVTAPELDDRAGERRAAVCRDDDAD